MIAPLNASKEVSLNNKKAKWFYNNVSLDLIIRFPQVRQTFDSAELQELADDIATNGVIQPSTVIKFSPEHFFDYVSMIEKISRIKLRVKDFPYSDEEDGRWYYVLVAGERRFRAHEILWNSGCTTCRESVREKNDSLLPGQCYANHTDTLVYGVMEARIGVNIDLEVPKSIQFRENNYVKPPVHEEANAYCAYFNYLKLLNKKITFKEFAQKVGVSVEKVRKAIWYCDLPSKIKEAVSQKRISYGNALELYRVLQVETLDKKIRLSIVDQETDFLLMHPKIKNDDYRSRVKSIIESFQTITLFDLNDLLMGKKEKRKVVQGHLVTQIALYDSYTEKVQFLISKGVIGKEKMYSGLSPTRHIKEITLKLQQIIPGFRLTEKQEASLLFNLDKKPLK